MQTTLTINISIDELRELIADEIGKALSANQPVADVVDDTDELIKIADVAKMFKVSKVTIFKWKKQGKIPFFRISNKVYFKRSEVLASMIKIEAGRKVR